MKERKPTSRREIPVKILVLDVLKPHKPNILELGKGICEEKSVENANISVYAVDEKTESIKIVLEGEDIKFDRVAELIESYGAVIHSMDKVVLGKKKVIEVPLVEEKR
ncbi:MAG: hypothetical protein DRO89_01960 [Candidatus Altiarchaeales archaeon]|nr:MAG: hypothetical protein DRO89_01960 [Candidatus Altiarchaeales archaeon]